MASKPGILTEWPWAKLGSFKYLVLAPWVLHSACHFGIKGEKESLNTFLILPFLVWRILHNLIWISYSRHRTANGKKLIVDKNIEFEQVDRENSWDDQIILSGWLLYLIMMVIPEVSKMPLWRTNGVVLIILIHAGAIEFLYYWLHRALHHHYLYSRYHSHHHSSIVTEPITSVTHPFAEHVMYYTLFSIPVFATILSGTGSMGALFGYITYIDLMNNMGHCNFELVPKRLFQIFPVLKYLMYTPSYHSLHHTQFRTNYSLFMPLYDYMYGTMDSSTDKVHETSLKRKEETPNIVHLTHPTTLESIYHLRLGFAWLAARPYTSKWYLWALLPVTWWFMLVAWICGQTFVVERNMFNQLKLQTWAIPRYSFQYFLSWQREAINNLIEEAIVEADKSGVKVLSLGLLNQGEELNRSGKLYIQKHPKLKVRVVDGSSLAVAVILNSIPKGTKQVLLRGNLSKVAYAIVQALCEQGVEVATVCRHEHEKLKLRFGSKFPNNLIISRSFSTQVWLVGDGLRKDEQRKAVKGTIFIPFSQFPPTIVRKDCIYYTTPAMMTPKAFQNMHSCENLLPRKVMSAWRVAGIVHALEEWNSHECGEIMLDTEKIWLASLRHGFQPVVVPAHN